MALDPLEQMEVEGLAAGIRSGVRVWASISIPQHRTTQ